MTVSSIDEAFANLLQRIELNPSRVTLASQRYNAVKETIEGALPGKSVHQIGSFQRKTKIRPLDLSDGLDVDALVSFGSFYRYAATGEEGVTPAKAMQIVLSALHSTKTYQVMPKERDHPVVRLQYADQMAIELAPAYEDQTGQHSHGSNGPVCYIVGASPGTWRATDYDYDAETISRLNGVTAGRLIPTIKLVKAYFRNSNVPIKSFHSEILVANVVPPLISEWEAKRYHFGYHHILAGFLGQASKIVTNPVSIPGSFSPPVNSELNNSTLVSVSAFLNARADVAWQLCTINILASAVNGWHEFFGEPFPS